MTLFCTVPSITPSFFQIQNSLFTKPANHILPSRTLNCYIFWPGRLSTMGLNGRISSTASSLWHIVACRISLPLCCKSSLTLSIHLLLCRTRLLVPDCYTISRKTKKMIGALSSWIKPPITFFLWVFTDLSSVGHGSGPFTGQVGSSHTIFCLGWVGSSIKMSNKYRLGICRRWTHFVRQLIINSIDIS